MALVVVGLNHKTAPVEVRECFAWRPGEIPEALRQLKQQAGVSGAVILSTCNRTEVYGSGRLPALTEELTKLFSGKNAVSLQDYLYIYTEEAVAAHLFRVAGSLDSLVLGEGQILHQVKEAYDLAFAAGSTDFFLNALFKRAISAGKKVRRETDIGKNKTSVSATAVAFAQETLGPLEGKSVLLIGAGKISELTAKALQFQGVETVFVANRTYKRAIELAEAVGGKVIHFEQIGQYLAFADIIISSTGAPHYVLREAEVREALPQRRGKPLFCLDLAVPRDIDPAVGSLEGVSLYNIDSLHDSLQEGFAFRQREAQRAEALLQAEVERFSAWLEAAPVVASLREEGERICREQVQAVLEKFPARTEQEQQSMQMLAEKIAGNVLAPVIAYLLDLSPGEEREQAMQLVQKIFKLNTD